MIIAGTGHRPDKLQAHIFQSRGGWPGVHEVIVDLLVPALTGVATHVISGMALGWDLGLAMAARRAGIPWTAAIPFRGQESIWPQRAQQAYRNILSSAAYVVEVCEPGFAAWKFQARNEWMTDHCDLLLACWNGSDGGTANCVRYAEGRKPIVNVWGEFCEAVEYDLPF